MPKGWLRPARKVSCTSRLPSPFTSRTSVMRLAEGPMRPAPSIAFRTGSGISPPSFSVFDSATSTSPFGST